MQSRRAAAVAVAGVLVFGLSTCLADDPASTAASSNTSRNTLSPDGWRPRASVAGDPQVAVQADRIHAEGSKPVPAQPSGHKSSGRFVAAQSPDDDRVPAARPNWQYNNSTRSTTTVPVPDFRPPGTAGRQADSTEGDEPARQSGTWNPAPSAAARAPATAPWSPPPFQPAAGYGDSTYVPNGAAPYSPLGANCNPGGPPADPYGIGDGVCSYTWNNLYGFALVDFFEQSGADRLAGRFGLNWGLPLIDDSSGFGVQFGGSGSPARRGPQYFLTAGVFYRSDMRQGSGWAAGGVVDWLDDKAFGAQIAQARLQASYVFDLQNEVGVWGTIPFEDDKTDTGRKVEAVDQTNLFYRHLWTTGWEASGWIGWRSNPNSFAIGGDTEYPLSDHWAVTAGGHYAFEDDGFALYGGLVLYPGGKAQERYIGQYRHMPYLPVADNTSMTLTRHR